MEKKFSVTELPQCKLNDFRCNFYKTNFVIPTKQKGFGALMKHRKDFAYKKIKPSFDCHKFVYFYALIFCKLYNNGLAPP